jgi:hypothetical protein
VNFVSGNDTAEAKIQGLQRPHDGREAFKRLMGHYEGVGIHVINICEADEVIKNFFYAREKPPHMWWAEFEKQLTAYGRQFGLIHASIFAFRHTGRQSRRVFQTARCILQNLRSHSLSPLLRNLDKPRKEYNPNASLSLERTAREWSRSLKSNNTDPVHFNLVNGGPDQLAYLILSSQHADIAAQHVETYRNRLYPRRKREGKFNADAGPPTTVHLR